MNGLDIDEAAQRAVDDYLGALRTAAHRLPPDRRDDLLTGIEEHIDVAVAEGAHSEAQVRYLLDRLGSPASIVAAEQEQGLGAATGSREYHTEVAALILLIGAELLVMLPPVALAMWVAGVVCTVLSRRWAVRDKLLALGVLAPGMWLLFAGVAMNSFPTEVCSTPAIPVNRGSRVIQDGGVTTCTGGPPDWLPWLAGGLLLVLVAAQVLVAVRLARRAR